MRKPFKDSHEASNLQVNEIKSDENIEKSEKNNNSCTKSLLIIIIDRQ